MLTAIGILNETHVVKVIQSCTVGAANSCFNYVSPSFSQYFQCKQQVPSNSLLTFSAFRAFIKARSLDPNQSKINNDVDCHKGSNFLATLKSLDCETRVAVI